MSQIKNKLRLLVTITYTYILILSTGCGSNGNDNIAFNSVTGQHPAEWLSEHGIAYLQNSDTCKECHGQDLHGGISNVSCFTASYNGTSCHANGPGHPPGWDSPDVHGTIAKAEPSNSTGFKVCQLCHGNLFQGGIVKVSCFTCHGVNAPHPPSPWRSGRTHVNTNPGNAPVCADCHRSAQGTPGCFNNTLCHGTIVCGSCHGIPPDGSIFPNTAGRHSIHNTFDSLVEDCSVCHFNAGYGTSNHQNNTPDVIIRPAFYAKSGSSSYNNSSMTCSNISCHGGQPTPNWLTGTIDVNTQCQSCHRSRTVSDQYNSYYSGKHDKHVNNEGIACFTCHDTAKLQTNHFKYLYTPQMEGPASGTLRDQLNYNPSTHTCNPQAGGLTGCHSSKIWQ
jgi:predicted CxxxxCH...CXXCH cytochrome family protein